jgi:hypothetical protein
MVSLASQKCWIRLKKLAVDKRSSLFGLVVGEERKRFMTLRPFVNVTKLFSKVTDKEANRTL